jgi:hypothetical protein
MNSNNMNYSPTEQQAKEDFALSQGLTTLLKLAYDMECCKTSSGGGSDKRSTRGNKDENGGVDNESQHNKKDNNKKKKYNKEESSSDDEDDDNRKAFWEENDEEVEYYRCTKKEIKGYRSYANMLILLGGGGSGVLLGPTTLSAVSSLANLLIDNMGYPTVEKLCTGPTSIGRTLLNALPSVMGTGYNVKTCSDAINFQDGIVKASMASITVALGISEGFFKSYKPSTLRDKLAAKICAYFKKRHLNVKPNISPKEQDDLEEKIEDQLKWRLNGGKRFTKKRVVYKYKRGKNNKNKNTFKFKRSKSKQSKSKRGKSKQSKSKQSKSKRIKSKYLPRC